MSMKPKSKKQNPSKRSLSELKDYEDKELVQEIKRRILDRGDEECLFAVSEMFAECAEVIASDNSKLRQLEKMEAEVREFKNES